MKLSLKFYRKLFRLFSLKKQEKAEIEKQFHTLLSSRTKTMYNEYVAVRHELSSWQSVARMYRIKSPYDLYKVLEGLHLQPDDYITEAQLKATGEQCAVQFSRKSCAEQLMKGVTDDSRNQDS